MQTTCVVSNCSCVQLNISFHTFSLTLICERLPFDLIRFLFNFFLMFSHAGIIRLLRTPRNKCRPTTSVIDFLGSEYSIACATLSNPHSNSASSSSSSEYNKALSLKSCGGLYGGSLLSLSSSWRNDPFGPTIRIDCELRELILNWSSSSSVLKAVSTFDNRTRSVAGSWLV